MIDEVAGGGDTGEVKGNIVLCINRLLERNVVRSEFNHLLYIADAFDVVFVFFGFEFDDFTVVLIDAANVDVAETAACCGRFRDHSYFGFAFHELARLWMC